MHVKRGRFSSVLRFWLTSWRIIFVPGTDDTDLMSLLDHVIVLVRAGVAIS